MGFFEKILGKQKEIVDGKEIDMPVFYVAEGEDKMEQAFEMARATFGYFWREMFWEYRRIVPALDIACVKVLFTQEINGEEYGEHMWINDVDFDGEFITGTLVNEPNDLTNVKNGDSVKVRISEISDWMFACEGKAYGAFSVHAIRSEMNKKERAEHDEMWGFDFGDFNDILVVREQKQHPEYLKDHPMCVNSINDYRKFLGENLDQLNTLNSAGLTMLQEFAVSGNLSLVKICLEMGADKNVVSKSGKLAIDYARELGWEEIVKILR